MHIRAAVQTVRMMKKHVSRVGIVRELLEFYMKNNVLYQESAVAIDEDALRRLSEDETCGVIVQRQDEREGAKKRGRSIQKQRCPGHSKGI